MELQTYRLPEGLDLRILYSGERIASEVSRLAAEISAFYADKDLLVVVVLKGAFFFAADLLRALRIPVQVDFLSLSSYDGQLSTGNVTLKRDLATDVAGRDVLVVEDIIDTGLTLAFLTDLLRQRGVRSLRVCTLIDKKRHRAAEVTPDYLGISCDDGFLVGYGLDLDERLRELPAIYEVIENPLGGVE